MITKDEVKRNYDEVLKRVNSACERAGRGIEEITIVAVSKLQPPKVIRFGFEAGIKIFGENRVQETEEKWAELADIRKVVSLHLVGHLQRNKAKDAVVLYDVIESVDNEQVALELNRRLEISNRAKPMPVLVEVNTSGEETKYGVNPDVTFSLLERIRELPNLDIIGLMTVGPLTTDEKRIGMAFSELRELGEKAKEFIKPNDGVFHLSMGMTDDFEIAIEEGSTMIRVGRAIFGERSS